MSKLPQEVKVKIRPTPAISKVKENTTPNVGLAHEKKLVYFDSPEQFTTARSHLQAFPHKVTSIDRVISSTLAARFAAKQDELASHGRPYRAALAFHGSMEGNFPSIMRLGLVVPGQDNNVSHATDTGFWGRGIYLSPNYVSLHIVVDLTVL
jgi:hypothetical protein